MFGFSGWQWLLIRTDYTHELGKDQISQTISLSKIGQHHGLFDNHVPSHQNVGHRPYFKIIIIDIINYACYYNRPHTIKILFRE